jgi:hypothetical protein
VNGDANGKVGLRAPATRIGACAKRQENNAHCNLSQSQTLAAWGKTVSCTVREGRLRASCTGKEDAGLVIEFSYLGQNPYVSPTSCT